MLLYHRGDSPGSDAALTSAYEVMREAPPSRAKTTVLGLVARTALERGDGDRALELALEAEAAAAAADGIPPDVAAYAAAKYGLAEIALGDPDGLARISDSDTRAGAAAAAAGGGRAPRRPGRHADRARPAGRRRPPQSTVCSTATSRAGRGSPKTMSVRSERHWRTGRVTGEPHAQPPTSGVSAVPHKRWCHRPGR